MPRTLAKWLLLTALIAYAVLMAAWAASQVHSRPCAGLRVEVVPPGPGVPAFLTPKAVERELGDLPARAKGTPLSAIDTEALERRLMGVNNFESAECVITSDGYLLVRVVPIVPEARVFTPSGTYYINKEGKRLDAHAEYFVNLPVIHGAFTDKMPARLALPVARFVQRDSLLRSLVAMIDFRSPSNIILIPRIAGHVVNIGDTTRLREKADALALFYRKVMPRKGWDAYDTISVKFRGQIVATRADKTPVRHAPEFTDTIPDSDELNATARTKEAPELSPSHQKSSSSTHTPI